MFFFDTYAIIELMRGNGDYAAYLKEPLHTSLLNLGEFYYALLKDGADRRTAKLWYGKLRPLCMELDIKTIHEAMDFKYTHRKKNLSFIDCVGYMLARRNSMTFLTGDKEFRGMENVEFVPGN